LIEIYDKPYILIIDDVPTYINQQYFKEKYKIIAGLLYAKFDLEKNVVKLSLRQGFDNNIDCNELIKLITDGNGGGHFAASGGAIELVFQNELRIRVLAQHGRPDRYTLVVTKAVLISPVAVLHTYT
jgi:hypothetical protein